MFLASSSDTESQQFICCKLHPCSPFWDAAHTVRPREKYRKWWNRIWKFCVQMFFQLIDISVSTRNQFLPMASRNGIRYFHNTWCPNPNLLYFGSVPLQKLKMEERVATYLDHFQTVDYRVLCDDQSSLASIYGQVFITIIVAKGSKISRTWLYWHARTFDISACIHWLFDIILDVPHCCWRSMFSPRW